MLMGVGEGWQHRKVTSIDHRSMTAYQVIQPSPVGGRSHDLRATQADGSVQLPSHGVDRSGLDQPIELRCLGSRRCPRRHVGVIAHRTSLLMPTAADCMYDTSRRDLVSGRLACFSPTEINRPVRGRWCRPPLPLASRHMPRPAGRGDQPDADERVDQYGC
jgi:hypothetical protein